MRLGGPVFTEFATPEEWVRAVRGKGYTTAYCPCGPQDPDPAVAAYESAAQQAGIVIAEVGAWSNPLSRDEPTRRAAIRLCQERLALADRIGARCCVNIAGSRGARWDGPHADNYTEATFDLIIETVRGIIDAVKPTRTFYALETMPWMLPDSTASYERLIRVIDRPAFAVHFDPVNLICSPRLYYATGDLIREFLRRLGPWVRSCHAKDIILAETLTTHLDETRPGLGGLDYRTYLTALSRLDADVPLLLEHLKTEADYDLAAAHIRAVAAELQVGLG